LEEFLNQEHFLRRARLMKHARKESIGMKRRMLLLPVFLVAVVALVLGAAATDLSAWFIERVPLDDTSIIVEVNDTDGDAGFQIFADGEGWRWVSVYDPDWNRIFKVRASGGVKDVGGGTEVFSETAEPEYETFDEYQSILDNLQPGTYKFYGRSVEGALLFGTATLTHNIPCAPELISPSEVDPEEEAPDTKSEPVNIRWEEVDSHLGEDPEEPGAVGCTDDEAAEIDGYQVIVEGEDGEFDVILPDDVTNVDVPDQVTDPGKAYKFEVLAIEESGNQTIVESYFCTEPLADEACRQAALALD
jgi:hypothetical protein